MKFSFFRISKNSTSDIVTKIKQNSGKHDIKIVSQIDVDKTTILGFLNESWTNDLLRLDKNLIGLLPSSIYITEKGNTSEVGFSSPLIIGGVTQNEELIKLSELINSKLTSLLEESASLEPLVVKNIKLFSTMSCPYCKMEAKWLEEKDIKFTDVHVDLNREEAERMVQKTGQMGVPVTEIEFDNGEFEYIVGFDKNRLKQVLSVN